MRRGSVGKALAGLAALGMLVAGGAVGGALPAAQATGAAEPATKVIRVGTTQAVDSMNPFLAVRLVTGSIHRWMYGFLTVPDSKTLQPSADLAESWTTSPDGLTWTFKIREATWSDGQPITAADAAWTFTKIMTDDGAKTGNGPAV
jgi:peptide/nickel transport system substrate-binding protein